MSKLNFVFYIKRYKQYKIIIFFKKKMNSKIKYGNSCFLCKINKKKCGEPCLNCRNKKIKCFKNISKTDFKKYLNKKIKKYNIKKKIIETNIKKLKKILKSKSLSCNSDTNPKKNIIFYI